LSCDIRINKAVTVLSKCYGAEGVMSYFLRGGTFPAGGMENTLWFRAPPKSWSYWLESLSPLFQLEQGVEFVPRVRRALLLTVGCMEGTCWQWWYSGHLKYAFGCRCLISPQSTKVHF